MSTLTPEQEVLREIKAEIASQPVAIQNLVGLIAENMRATVRTHAGVGHLALALVGAEMAAEAS